VLASLEAKKVTFGNTIYNPTQMNGLSAIQWLGYELGGLILEEKRGGKKDIQDVKGRMSVEKDGKEAIENNDKHENIGRSQKVEVVEYNQVLAEIACHFVIENSRNGFC